MAEIRSTYEGGYPTEPDSASGTLAHVEGLIRFHGTRPASDGVFGVTKVRFLLEPAVIRGASLSAVGLPPGKARLHILCDDDVEQWICRFEMNVADGGHLMEEVHASRSVRGEHPLPSVEGLVDAGRAPTPVPPAPAPTSASDATVFEEIRDQLKRIADALERRFD